MLPYGHGVQQSCSTAFWGRWRGWKWEGNDPELWKNELQEHLDAFQLWTWQVWPCFPHFWALSCLSSRERELAARAAVPGCSTGHWQQQQLGEYFGPQAIFLRWPNCCLNIFYKYMEKWGFFKLLYPLFCFTQGICIVTIIINALVLGPDAENFVFNSIWFYRRGSILWEDKRKFSWCYRQWERRKSAQGLSSACQYGCSATRKHIQGFFLVWMLKQHKVANTIVFIVEYV